MAYDETLATRIRAQVSGRPGVTEKKMFGGVCWMVGGNMFAGITKDDLMVRVPKDMYEELQRRPGARPMDFTGRPMVGMLFVGRDGWATEEGLLEWIDLTWSYGQQQPVKAPKEPKSRKGRDTAP